MRLVTFNRAVRADDGLNDTGEVQNFRVEDGARLDVKPDHVSSLHANIRPGEEGTTFIILVGEEIWLNHPIDVVVRALTLDPNNHYDARHNK